MKHFLLILLAFVALGWCQLRAGAAKLDGTLPIGTPLAGYNHGDRRVPYWPLPQFAEYTTFMMPSQGVITPTWVKAVLIDDGKGTRIAVVTMDGIGSSGPLNRMTYDIAVSSGLANISYNNIVFSSSHTHSGPGGVATDMLWNMAPATDLLVPKLQRMLATFMAEALLQAQKNMVPAKIDAGTGYLVGVTHNRRADISPYVTYGTIDPNLGVLRVDDSNGKPIATVWNFAVHGTCYGPSNMMFDGDIMGGACTDIEKMGGGVALFVNGDAGDIDPNSEACENKPNFKGSPVIAKAVMQTRQSLQPTTDATIKAVSSFVYFGPTDLNATLGRFNNCTHGGPLDICSFCEIFDCDANVHMYSQWLENDPKFTAFKFTIRGNTTVAVSIPGEALVELGWWIRNATAKIGFDNTWLYGYSNNHMGYFATPDEYDIGGYESQLTFWGIKTAQMIADGCKLVAQQVWNM